MTYRREIDGLRALAVLAVIFFHAGLNGFKGGFVGVDVFFVISGYLITSIIISDVEDDRFSLANFYERRARRILPALVLVVFVCMPFGWVWLIPIEYKEFFKSVIAAFFFSSNILFWRETGYFDTLAELKPLLHTWSLSVEEQYYLVFPLLFLLLWRFGYLAVIVGLAILFSGSFGLAIWAVEVKPSLAFYSLFTRAWELLLGAFLAILVRKKGDAYINQYIEAIGSAVGLLLILWSIFIFDKSTHFPGWNALAPAGGAFLVILFANSSNLTGRLLGHPLCVGLGLISYSSYLWHQPIFAFAKRFVFLWPSYVVFLGLSLVSILLGYVTWRYVETPFRRSEFIGRKNFVLLSIVVGGAIVAVAAIGISNQGFKHRLPPNVQWQSLGEKLAQTGDVCKLAPLPAFIDISVCDFGSLNSDRKVILLGDSHAQAIAHELDAQLKNLNIKGIRVVTSGCELIPSVVEVGVRYRKNCDAIFDNLKRYIKAHNSPVILLSRWSFRLYPIVGEIEAMPYANSEGGIENEAYRRYAVYHEGELLFEKEAKHRAVTEFIEGLLATKAPLLLVYPIPEIAWDIASLNWRSWVNQKVALNEISIPYDDYLSRNAFISSTFDEFSGASNFHAIRPAEIFCNTFVVNRCVAQYGGVPFYFDDDHLSDAGARLLVDEIIIHLR